MNRRISLVLIALIGVGLYALPSTMALFAGQHSFVNIDATGNQIDCVKCHGDVQAELGGQDSTVTGTDGPHANFECAYCHRVEAGASSGDNAYALITYSGTGVNKRFLAITVQSMEEQRWPATIVANQTAVTGLKGKYKLSPVQAGFELNNTVILTAGIPSSVKLLATYDNGAPLDTNAATRYGGLDLSQSKFEDGFDRKGNVVPYSVVNLTGAGSEAVNPGSAYHAASLVSCMECHGGADHGPLGHYTRVLEGEDGANSCSNCHSGPVDTHNYVSREFDAGGFGLTVGNPDDTGATEAHNEFVMTDDGLTRFGGYSAGEDDPALYASNGACIACHTHVKVDITYTKPETMKFNVDMTSSTEVLSDFGTNGTVVSTN